MSRDINKYKEGTMLMTLEVCY